MVAEGVITQLHGCSGNVDKRFELSFFLSLPPSLVFFSLRCCINCYVSVGRGGREWDDVRLSKPPQGWLLIELK